MKKIHCETDSMRLTRLGHLFLSPASNNSPTISFNGNKTNAYGVDIPKGKDCSECGLIFITEDEKLKHFKK